MKLSKNQKILASLVVGAATAYGLNRLAVKNQKKTVTETTPAPSGKTVSTIDPNSKEGKIEFILDNVETTPSEEKSGFDGDRFYYDPKLGYLLPSGTVNETDSGSEMVIGKGGNLANELFFNADGQPTSDPTEEAAAILNEMTESEIDIAYNLIKGKKANPQLSFKSIANELGYDVTVKRIFENVVRPRIQDVKALKKMPTWKANWTNRKARFSGRVHPQAKPAKPTTGANPQAAKKARQNWLKQIFSNPQTGAMWGGQRHDGKIATPKNV